MNLEDSRKWEDYQRLRLIENDICKWRIQRTNGIAICGEPIDTRDDNVWKLCNYHFHAVQAGRWTAKRQSEDKRELDQQSAARKLSNGPYDTSGDS